MAVRNQIDERDTWMVDSGCSGHITNNMKWYIDYIEFSMPRIIKGLAPETTLAWGTGTVLLPALRPEGRSELELQDVWFAPTAPCNMLSPNRLEELGAIHDQYTSSLTQVEPRVILASIVPWNGVKAVQLNMEAVSKLKETDETRLAFFSMDFKVLHRRLMHAGVERTLKAADQAGIRLSNKPNGRFHCESCELAKSHQIISREPQTPAERPFQRVHFDLIEYKKGWGDKKWAIHFQDAYSNYQWVRMLASKREIRPTVMEWLDFIENQTSLRPQIIHIDGFRETIDFLKVYCAKRGIALNITVPYTPAQNGKIEKSGRTLNDQSRATCIDVGLPAEMWPYALESSAYVNNLIPTSANPELKSPHERLMSWFNAPERSIKPFLRHLRTFGCVAYVHLKEQRRQKRRPRDHTATSRNSTAAAASPESSSNPI
jgi:hypothetical protein